MKKLREMKKNNKGFSLVELIVVIAIMVVLVAVLGSTILGYIDESKYSKDIQALDAIDTAMMLLVAEPNSKLDDAEDVCTLSDLIDGDDEKQNLVVIRKTLAETFSIPSGESVDGTNCTFNNSSPAFASVTFDDILVQVTDGAVKIYVDSKGIEESDADGKASYPAYKSPSTMTGKLEIGEANNNQEQGEDDPNS